MSVDSIMNQDEVINYYLIEFLNSVDFIKHIIHIELAILMGDKVHEKS